MDVTEFTKLKRGDRVKQGSIEFEVVSMSTFYGELDIAFHAIEKDWTGREQHTFTTLIAGCDTGSIKRLERIEVEGNQANTSETGSAAP